MRPGAGWPRGGGARGGGCGAGVAEWEKSVLKGKPSLPVVSRRGRVGEYCYFYLNNFS